MYISSALLTALLGTCSLQVLALALPSLEKRIVGGFIMPDTMAPYSVSLLKTDGSQQFTCGGTILSPNFILTAAHCVVSKANTQLPPANVTIGHGSMDRDAQKTLKATGVFIHPQYMSEKGRDVRYDIALVEVKKLKLNKATASVPIYDGKIGAGQQLLAMGWGSTEANATKLNMLRGTIVTTGDTANCKQYYPEFEDNNGPQLCVLGKLNPGSSTCNGDSGSSVVASNQGVVMLAGFDSIGVFTVGSSCGDPHTAHFFIHAGFHLDFITSITNITKEVLTSAPSTKPEQPEQPEQPGDDDEYLGPIEQDRGSIIEPYKPIVY